MLLLPKIAFVWIIIFTSEIGNSLWPAGPFYNLQECEKRIEKIKQERVDYKLDPIQLDCKQFFHIGWENWKSGD